MEEPNDRQEPAPSLETPNKKKLSLRNKILLGGGGVVLAVVAVTGIGVAVVASSHKAPKATLSSAQADPTPDAASAAEATPSATPTTPETTATVSYNYGLTQADVDPLLAKDVYALNTGTVEEKAKIAMFYAQDLPKFANDWALISHNPKDALLPAVVGADNTPDEINALTSNAHRQAMTLTQADGFHFDKVTSDKLLAASFINGTLSPAYKNLGDFSAQLDGPDSAPSDQSLPASHYMQLPIINKASDKYTDAAGRTCIDMNITQPLNGGAAPVTADITDCLVKNTNGSIWMQRQ